MSLAFIPEGLSRPYQVPRMETATSTNDHRSRATLTETVGESARPVCVLRSDVTGLGNIQLTRERSTVVIGRSRSVDYRIDHPQARRSNRSSLTHRNSPHRPARRSSLRVVHSCQVSGLQCTLRLEEPPGQRVLVTDSSTNGTFVNGEEVARGETRELPVGAVMTILVRHGVSMVYPIAHGSVVKRTCDAPAARPLHPAAHHRWELSPSGTLSLGATRSRASEWRCARSAVGPTSTHPARRGVASSQSRTWRRDGWMQRRPGRPLKPQPPPSAGSPRPPFGP